MGSNGLTSARHDMFAKYLAMKYPESFDHQVPSELVYSGKYALQDKVEGAPVSAVKALRAIYDSNGLAETVTDEEILDAQKLLARTEGVGVEPASAASIAGLKKLVEQGDIDKGERVVCVVTGHLLKDPNTAIDACVDPVQVDADIDKIKEILLNK